MSLSHPWMKQGRWCRSQQTSIGGTFDLYFEMEDVDEFYARVKDKVNLLFELADEPYGMREFTIRDCNGYVLAFAQRI